MLSDSELRAATLFKSVTAAQAALPNVHKFTMRGARTALDSIPDEVAAFKDLQVLDVGGVPIRSLPTWIGDLSNLQVLKFDETNVPTIPPSMARLTCLHTLATAFNSQLVSGFENITPLTNLRALTVNGIALASMDIRELSNLEALLLDSLAPTHDLAPVYSLAKLKKLELCGQEGLSTLPNGLGALSALESLVFLAVPLTKLPEEISALPKLKSLDFSGLGLVTPPEGTNPHVIDTDQFLAVISKCPKLKEVKLTSNFLATGDSTARLAELLAAELPKLRVLR
jgi:Leucine-rich repeat (LRR) protein